MSDNQSKFGKSVRSKSKFNNSNKRSDAYKIDEENESAHTKSQLVSTHKDKEKDEKQAGK